MRFWINRNNATTTRSNSGTCGFSSDFTATLPITVGTSPTGGSWGENSGRLLGWSGDLPDALSAGWLGCTRGKPPNGVLKSGAGGRGGVGVAGGGLREPP